MGEDSPWVTREVEVKVEVLTIDKLIKFQLTRSTLPGNQARLSKRKPPLGDQVNFLKQVYL